MDTLIVSFALVLCLGAAVIGLAIGAMAWLLYQMPREMERFRKTIEEATWPLNDALANAAEAQKLATLRTQQYGNLMRTLGDYAPPTEEARIYKRKRERPPSDWNPDWAAQQQEQDAQAKNPVP